MAVTYGFFNSVNGDRKYNAEQMSEYFRGIINEGVYQHLDGGLAVTAGTGLAVNVAAGRAIIQNRWVQNSAAMSLTIAAASETYARKDAVVIRLNWSSRAISIVVKTGTPAASPVAPSMTRNSTTYEMALAYVNVAANATSVTVTDKRSDNTVCGWVTVAQSTSGEVDAQLNAMKTGFDGVTYSSPAAMVQGEDQKIANATGMASADYMRAFSGDFNDLKDNQKIGFTNTTGATNKPMSDNGGGLLIVNRGSMLQYNAIVQTFIHQTTGAMYQRFYWTSWTAWEEIAKGSRAILSDNGDYIVAFTGNFNDLKDNGIHSYTNLTGATNAPTESGGTLLVFKGNVKSAISTVQIFITGFTGKMYSRIHWGNNVWSDWAEIQTGSGSSQSYEFNFATLALFDKIGVLGDSYASGWIYQNNVGANHFDISWGQILARRNGITCVNLSSGGLTTKTWLTDARGLALLNSSDAQNLYMVCLGLNDQIAINQGTYTLGDATDYANKTDTFYGNYAKIIDAIRTKAPNAKIILCTVSEGDTTTFAQVSTAITAIGGLASVPVINVLDDPYITSTFFINSLNVGHPTAASYSGYATMIERLFSKCCIDNYAYFKDYAGNN